MNIKDKNRVRDFSVLMAEAVAVGLACGLIGVAFHHAVDGVTALRGEYPHILYLLPLAGVVIAFIYKVSGQDKLPGTDYVLSAVAKKDKVPFLMLPVIFFSSVLTHLCGGSAGREGAALQLGGSVGSCVSDAFRQKPEARAVLIMGGMGGVFSALFGTPLTAAAFSVEVIAVGKIRFDALPFSLVTSFMSYWVAGLFHGERVRFDVTFPGLDPTVMISGVILAFLAAAVSIVFTRLMHFSHCGAERLIKNPYIRSAVGGFAVIAMTLLVGSQRYNGAGMAAVEAAMEGEAQWFDFLLKMIFTSVTIGFGFKGGEIVPAFFIGSTFGSVVGGLLGLPVGMGAAIGLVAVFCGCVNCPIASILLGLELFGIDFLPYVTLAAVVAFVCTGRKFSLYHRDV